MLRMEQMVNTLRRNLSPVKSLNEDGNDANGKRRLLVTWDREPTNTERRQVQYAVDNERASILIG